MTKLPNVGDTGWGDTLNEFLRVGHNEDGTPKSKTIDVKDFGATGDGTTDDTAAIQSALNSIATSTFGGMIYFPPGTYFINQKRLSYTSLKPISLIGSGWGSKLLWNPATDIPVWEAPWTSQDGWWWGMLNIGGTGNDEVDHCPHVEIRDLNFNFGATNRLDAWNGTQRGLNIARADNIQITRCKFSHCRAEMLGLGNFGGVEAPGKHAQITDCFFEHNVQDAINPNVLNCVIKGCTFKTGNGMFIEAGRSKFICTNCHFEDGRGQAVQLSAVDQFVVSNNLFYDCETYNWGGNPLGVINLVYGGSAAGCTNGTITGNTIKNTTQNTFQVGIATSATEEALRSERVIISNNVLEGQQQGIYIQQGADIQIHGNTVIAGAASSTGIVIANTALNINNHIYNNKVMGNWSNAKYENLTPTSQRNLIEATFYGVGPPEGVITGLIGFKYINLSGGANKTYYIKETGTGNTGWKAISTI